MSGGSFKDFRKKYENRVNEEEAINLLLDDKIRNYIIENDDCDFLASIASSSNDELRLFYFNEQTIPHIIQLGKFPGVLFRSDFFPNKIKLFDHDLFLKSLTLGNNTHLVASHINKEFRKQSDYSDVTRVLKNGLYKFMHYLQQDFINEIKNISIFMKELPSELYKEFLDYISDDLKQVAIQNEEMMFDEIFSNSFIKCSDISFEDVENIIHHFKGIDNLCYSPSLLYTFINKSADYKGLIINEQELNRLKDYIFHDYCKEVFLKNLDYWSLERLYMCFSNEIIDYLLDDEGLAILENNYKFDKLLSNDIPYDKLTKSKTFAMLLSKNYPEFQDYDNKIDRIEKLLSNDKSFYHLLNRYIELKDYSHFFRVFTKLSGDKQLFYFKNHSERLLEFNNSEIFKGMKREVYELFKDRINIKNYTFSDYDLCVLLNHKDSYSLEQLECIFSNQENIFAILKGKYIKSTYEMILNLNISKLNQIYMSEEVLSFLRSSNKLDRIYEIVDKLEMDASPLLLNTNCLIDIGETVENDYKKSNLSSFDTFPRRDVGNAYFYFLLRIPSLKDHHTLFKILDFYLTRPKYLSTFYILRNDVEKEVLQEYLISRKDLITEIIQENNCDSSFILGKLPDNIRKSKFFKDRENVAIHLADFDYYRLFRDDFDGKYRLDEKILDDDRFIEKFVGYYRDVEESLRFVTDNEMLIKKLLTKVKLYNDMKNKIVRSLNDAESEFKTYLEILMNSGIDVYEIEFLKDMIDVVFFNKRIKEVFFKYKSMNLEKIKLEILNHVIKSSRENIASSITNPLDKNIVYMEYTLGDEKVSIPTIVYDNETYTFLVRRVRSGKHFYDGTYKDGIEYYSTITEKNRSMYYGDSGVKFGYVRVKPEDIIQVNSFDAISQNSNSNKYIAPYIKYPEWVSMEELNKRTLESQSYNELRIQGKYIPDFVISYDEPNDASLRYSYEHSTPMVKILRKCYPNAIEQCEDPYSDWQ